MLALDVKDCGKLREILGKSYFYKLVRVGVIARDSARDSCSFSIDFVKELTEGLILLCIYLRPRAKDRLVLIYKELINVLGR